MSSSLDARPHFFVSPRFARGWGSRTRSTGRERHQTHKRWMPDRPTDRPTDRDAEIVIPRVELELEPRLCVCVSYVRSQSLVSRSRISSETGYDRTFGTNAIVPRATASASFQHTTRRLQCPRSSLPLSSAASPPSRRPRFKYVFRACFRDARAVEDDAETAR